MSEVTTAYENGGHLSHVTWIKYITFFPPLPGGCIWNLNEIGPLVAEGSPLQMLTDYEQVTTDQVTK